MKILAIALIGRHNQPLFVRSYSTPRLTAEEELKWHFAAHTSLDVFEKREAAGVKQNEHYAGLLQVMDDYAVYVVSRFVREGQDLKVVITDSYGYQSSTRTKFVLILSLTEESVKDNDIKTIFRAIHNAYIGYLANPFCKAVNEQPDYVAPPIRSVKFEKKLEDIAQAQNVE